MNQASTQSNGPKVSIVVPVYRSAECLEELASRVKTAFARFGRSYELILVNDGSPDDSWARIRRLAETEDSVLGVNLRRNAGQDNAIMAGLSEASGEVVIIMDDDLQHDPNDCDELIKKVEDGFDVCYARFRRNKQAWWKNAGSWLNGKLANVVVGKPRHIYLSPFKAINGDVAREITSYEGPFPYVDGLLFRVSTNVTQVEVEHHERLAGKGTYNLIKSLSVWMKVATLFSVVPLRIASLLGFVFSVIGLLLGVYFTIEKLVLRAEPVGWASMMVAVLVLGGIQLACLGILGEYIGRSFLHLNKRPQYVVKEKIRRTEVCA
jgi:glycosyltransferase involved in cell wall biosynthesis